MLRDNIKKARTSAHFSQEKLGSLLGVTQQSVGKWEKGISEPDIETLKRIANILNIPLSNLIDDQSIDDKFKKLNTDVVFFPVIGKVKAGFDGVADEELTGENLAVPTSNLRGLPPEHYFVLQVSGDSMYPRLLDGDKVLVERCESVDSGTVAIVLYNGYEATIKKIVYRMGEDWVDLIPLNTTYPPRRIAGAELQNCRVLGKVVSLIRSF